MIDHKNTTDVDTFKAHMINAMLPRIISWPHSYSGMALRGPPC